MHLARALQTRAFAGPVELRLHSHLTTLTRTVFYWVSFFRDCWKGPTGLNPSSPLLRKPYSNQSLILRIQRDDQNLRLARSAHDLEDPHILLIA